MSHCDPVHTDSTHRMIILVYYIINRMIFSSYLLFFFSFPLDTYWPTAGSKLKLTFSIHSQVALLEMKDRESMKKNKYVISSKNVCNVNMLVYPGYTFHFTL